ncbi:hypothetical protein V8D89_007054 [Ganoderma adspersum]
MFRHPRKTRPSAGVMLLPYVRNRDDEELSAMKGAFDIDIEAGVNDSARPSSGSRAVVLDILKVFRLAATPIGRAWARGLPCSAALYAIGTLSLNGVRPFTSVELCLEFPASVGGAAVAAPATVGALAFVDFILHGLDLNEDHGIAVCLDEVAGVAGLLSSVFATPLGFAIMSWFMPEMFEVWHAVVVTAAGLSVLGGLLMFGLILALVVVLL